MVWATHIWVWIVFSSEGPYFWWLGTRWTEGLSARGKQGGLESRSRRATPAFSSGTCGCCPFVFCVGPLSLPSFFFLLFFLLHSLLLLWTCVSQFTDTQKHTYTHTHRLDVLAARVFLCVGGRRGKQISFSLHHFTWENIFKVLHFLRFSQAQIDVWSLIAPQTFEVW